MYECRFLTVFFTLAMPRPKEKGGDFRSASLTICCLFVPARHEGRKGHLVLIDQGATDVHLDLLRLGFGALAQLDFQDAVCVIGADVFGVHRDGFRIDFTDMVKMGRAGG